MYMHIIQVNYTIPGLVHARGHNRYFLAASAALIKKKSFLKSWLVILTTKDLLSFTYIKVCTKLARLESVH